MEKERQSDLIIEENVSISGQFVTIYTDWDRDGVFVSQDQSSLSMRDKGFTASFQVPADAELGKARIRVRLDSRPGLQARMLQFLEDVCMILLFMLWTRPIMMIVI